MDRRERRSLAGTLIGHGVVLMTVFLSTAFVHRPRPQYMEVDLAAGGPAGPAAAAPAAPLPEPEPAVPQPRPEPEPQEPPRPPEPREFPTRKKPVEKPKVKKKVTPKPKPKPVKTQTAKPKVQVSRKLVTRGSAKPAPKTTPPGPAESAADIRDRMGKRFEQANASGSGAGEAAGNPGGSADRWAAFLAPLQDELHATWEQPSSAESGLTAIVEFRLERDGRLSGARITQSSGSSPMDQSVLLAVKTLGMYRPWPEGFTASDAEIEVEFVCKPN